MSDGGAAFPYEGYQMSLFDYFAAHAPTEIPVWFKHKPPQENYPPRPTFEELDEAHRQEAAAWTRDGCFDLSEEIKWWGEKMIAHREGKAEWEDMNRAARYIQWRYGYAAMMCAERDIGRYMTKEKEMENAIEVVRDTRAAHQVQAALAPAPTSLVQALTVAAADPRVDVAKVERLWAMLKEQQAREAEEAFNEAMSRAQAKIEPVVRDRRNDHTKSTYATLAAINDSIVPIYSAEGIAVSFDTYKPEYDKDGKEINPPKDGAVRVIAIVSHGGHTRKYHLDGALDDVGSQGTKNKTGIQAMGSTVSYLRRYLVCMIFNVSTQDDDDGEGAKGNGNTGKRLDENVYADLLASLDVPTDEASLFKAYRHAYKTAEEAGDTRAIRKFTEKKDQRKKALGIRS